LDTTIKHYNCELGKISFLDDEEADSTAWLTVPGNANAGRTTLAAISQAREY
jgi:hypothetical protein